jgi:Asp-tRNA(Asn)/Glu-tRNA(Gln) amidotransferase B subunit
MKKRWSSTYQTVIGIEVHVQLNTETKLFSATSARTSSPNEHINSIDLALPGTLPVSSIHNMSSKKKPAKKFMNSISIEDV